MTTRTKASSAFLTKALESDGHFEAFVSVFDNIDSDGDIIRPGAYAAAITKSKATPLGGWPVVFAHQHFNPEAVLGKTTDAREVRPGDPLIPANAPDALKAGGGLWVAGDVDTSAPFAATVYGKMQKGLIAQWSFAYDVLEGGLVKVDSRDAFEMRVLDVGEVGPCLFGSNSATMTLAAKARSGGRTQLAKALEVLDVYAAGKALDLDVDADAVLAELVVLTKSADLVVLSRADLIDAFAAAVKSAGTPAAPPAPATKTPGPLASMVARGLELDALELEIIEA